MPKKEAERSGPSPENLEESRTIENLRRAYAEEAALYFRYMYYAALAEFEGLDRHSAAFKEIAEGGVNAVQGSLDFLKLVRDPETGIALGGTFKNLEALAQTETKQFSQTYPEMAKTARREGFSDIASWFDTLEKSKRSHVRRLRKLADD
jgi:rubrerythrin